MDNLSGTEVELNVPGSVPLISRDLERLQEIFSIFLLMLITRWPINALEKSASMPN